MTCIVGITEGGRVWMGGDSAVTCNGCVTLNAAGKVYRRSEFLMGHSGFARSGDLLRYVFEPPPVAGDLDAYMVGDFAAAVRKCLKGAGRLGKDDDGYEVFGGRMLVGVRGLLYEMDCGFSAARDTVPYAAVGSGCEIALGAMYATEGKRPEERIRLALEAAERWTSGVRGPFTILNTEDK